MKKMEIMDIVNEQDVAIGQAAIDDIYDQKLPHRIVHVMVKNQAGEIALQLRSQKKKFCPGFWCTSAGGHVQSGENYETAVAREFFEELGVSLPLTFVDRLFYDDFKGLKKFLGVFETISEGPFAINRDEVDEVKFFSLTEIKKMIENGEKFHPELLFVLERMYL